VKRLYLQIYLTIVVIQRRLFCPTEPAA